MRKWTFYHFPYLSHWEKKEPLHASSMCSNETQDKEFVLGSLWILFLWWLGRYIIGTSLWQKFLLALHKHLSGVASRERVATGFLLTLPYPARPLPCPARLVTSWTVGVCCVKQSLALGVLVYDVGYKCGITTKDLKVRAQVVHGGYTARNSSMTVTGCWRRAALRAEKKLLYINVNITKNMLAKHGKHPGWSARCHLSS